MRKELRKTILYLSQETLFILLTIASAVILPQILHTAGAALGIGGKLGQIFLQLRSQVLRTLVLVKFHLYKPSLLSLQHFHSRYMGLML